MGTELIMDDSYELINGRKVVKKHVATIHCTNKLSLLERKISNVLLFHAYPNLKKSLIHEISLDKLKRLLNSVTRNHKALKEALKTLISTVIEWNILGDKVPELDLEGWNASTILSSVSVRNGIVKYQYSELIKSLIVDPAIYGKINLLIQSRFKSSYALALYENCARYRGLKYTKEFTYPLFRKLMGVVEEGKYEIFRDFNRRVLSPAVTEINTCSDIFIVPDITRRGRKVHAIKFTIEERAIKKRLGIQPAGTGGSKAASNLIETLSKEFGMDINKLKKLISRFGEKRVGMAAEYVKSRPNYRAGTVMNKAGYLRAAIEECYEIRQSSVSSNVESAKIRSRRRDEDAKLRNTWLEYERYIVNNSKKIFDSLDVDQKKEIEEGFLKGDSKHRNDIVLDYYEKFGLNNILVFEAGLAKYLLSQYPGFERKMMSFDEFKEKSNTVISLRGFDGMVRSSKS